MEIVETQSNINRNKWNVNAKRDEKKNGTKQKQMSRKKKKLQERIIANLYESVPADAAAIAFAKGYRRHYTLGLEGR